MLTILLKEEIICKLDYRGFIKFHFFCENKYECRKLLLSKIHCWSGDEITNECHDCDNCKQHEKSKSKEEGV